MTDTRKPGPERVPEALTLSKVEAARMLGISLRTIDRLIADEAAPGEAIRTARLNSARWSSQLVKC